MRYTLKVVFALLLVATLAGCAPWQFMGKPAGIRAKRTETITRQNNRRAHYGRVPLVKDRAARRNAQYTANRIAYQSGGGCALFHTDGTQLLWWYWAKVGENIGCIPGCIDARTAVKAFWNSPSHQAIILDGGYRRVGVGIQCVGNLSYFAVHFVA